jgi:predicted RNA-binding protein with PUA-like domain
MNVEFKFVKKTQLIPLAELRKHKKLENMRLLQPGSRLSITPVDPAEWEYITKKLMKA